MEVTLVLILPILYGLYRTVLAVWNLYVHPLAAFPGVRAAALSRNWLHQVHKRGHPEAEFERLHREFGTHALRIGPNELHINDVSLYKIIYSQKKPYLKDPVFYNAFQTPHTVFAETDPQLHRERRRMLNPYFSKITINKLEQTLAEKIEKLQRKIEVLSRRNHPINANNAFRCLTVDFITEHAFARSKNIIEKSDDNFCAPTLDAIDIGAASVFEIMFKPAIRIIGSFIPRAILVILNKDLASPFALMDEAKHSYDAYQEKGEHVLPVVFDAMKSVPADQVVAEAMDILFAGSDTTAATLTCAVWHISRNPYVKQKLISSLAEALPEPGAASLHQLELIPYLSAVVRESLRIAIPVPGRLPRIVPGANHDPLVVDGKVVPPGTVVGMSAYTMHNCEEIWGADASTFNPDRWLGDTAKHLESELATFSKGLRSCIGQNVAYMEVYMTLAMLYRNFEISLDPACEKFDVADHFAVLIKEPGVLLRMSKRI